VLNDWPRYGKPREVARTPSTKAVALKVLRDPKMSMATRLEAALTARPHLSDAKFAQLLRRLIGSSKRGPLIRECLRLLAELEAAQRKRAEADKVLAEESRRMQLKKQETQ
jgi:hypothetical protein